MVPLSLYPRGRLPGGLPKANLRHGSYKGLRLLSYGHSLADRSGRNTVGDASTGTLVQTKFGPAMTSTSTGVLQTVTDPLDDNNGGVTLVLAFRVNSLPGATAPIVMVGGSGGSAEVYGSNPNIVAGIAITSAGRLAAVKRSVGGALRQDLVPSAGAMAAGDYMVCVGRFSDGDNYMQLVLQSGYATAGSASLGPSGAIQALFGPTAYASLAGVADVSLALRAVISRCVSFEEARNLAADPWSLLEPQRIWVPVSAGGGGVTGTATPVEQADSATAAGTPVCTGTASPTEQADISAASGSSGSATTGTAAPTDSPDVSAASGSSSIVGTASPTDSPDQAAAAGSITATGTASPTDSPDSASADGWAGSITGIAAATESPDVSAATGTSGDTPLPSISLGNFGWDPRKRPSWRRKELRDELEKALENAPVAVQTLLSEGPPPDSPARLQEAVALVRSARTRDKGLARHSEIAELREAVSLVADFTAERERARQVRRRRQQHLLLLA